MQPIKWLSNPGSPIQAPLSYGGDYVISHRTDLFTVSYRPPGQHVHVAQVKTLKAAKLAAEQHRLTLTR